MQLCAWESAQGADLAGALCLVVHVVVNDFGAGKRAWESVWFARRALTLPRQSIGPYSMMFFSQAPYTQQLPLYFISGAQGRFP